MMTVFKKRHCLLGMPLKNKGFSVRSISHLKLINILMPSFRGQMCRDRTEEQTNKVRKKVEQTSEYICWSKCESKCL